MNLEQKLHKELDLHKPMIVGAGAVIGGLLTGGIGGTIIGAISGYIAAESAEYKNFYK